MKHRQAGFTLVELSIVLVVIGLIVSGIVVGKDLIKAAELRSVITDLREYQAALYTFKEKYSQFPGDLRNASEFWPTCDATPANCNGNGDGRIDDTIQEDLRAWQQLADAGMIAGHYTGVGTPDPGTRILETNVPASRVTGGAYMLDWRQLQIYSDDQDRQLINVGSITTAGTGTAVYGPLFNPKDAWTLDKKMDDGLADNGVWRVDNGRVGGAAVSKSSPDACVDGNITDSTAKYKLDVEAANCRAMWLLW